MTAVLSQPGSPQTNVSRNLSFIICRSTLRFFLTDDYDGAGGSLKAIFPCSKRQAASSAFQLLLCLFLLAKVLTTGDSLFCVRSNRQFFCLLRPGSLLRVFREKQNDKAVQSTSIAIGIRSAC